MAGAYGLKASSKDEQNKTNVYLIPGNCLSGAESVSDIVQPHL